MFFTLCPCLRGRRLIYGLFCILIDIYIWYNLNGAGPRHNFIMKGGLTLSNQKFKNNVIFRAWRIDKKTGKKLWARDYGLKAWPIPISELKK